MNALLSYYEVTPNKIVEETLHDHIVAGLQAVNRIDNSPISRYIKKTYPGLRNFYDIVRLAVVFHDVGKVLYQLDPSKVRGHISFFGHEIFSTYIFKKFCDTYYKEDPCFDREFGLKNFGLSLEKVIEFSILYHHHAMALDERIKYLSRDFIKLEKRLSLFEDLIEELDSFLSKKEKYVLEKTVRELKEKFAEPEAIMEVKNYCSDYIRNKVWYEVWLNKNGKVKKFSLILLSTLLVADNFAAQKNRGYSEGVFNDVLEEFHEHYLC